MKLIRTYSVDNEIYNEFNRIASSQNMNKSKFFQEKIEEFIKENKWISSYSSDTYGFATVLENEFIGNAFTSFPPSRLYVKEWNCRVKEKQFNNRSEFHPQFYIPKSKHISKGGWHALLVNEDNYEHGFKTMEEAQEFIDKFKKEQENRYPVKEVIHSPSKIPTEKFRVIEKKFDDKTEFHPEILIWASIQGGESKWISILVGTDIFKHGYKTMEEALDRIERYKKRDDKKFEEIIHEV